MGNSSSSAGRAGFPSSSLGRVGFPLKIHAEKSYYKVIFLGASATGKTTIAQKINAIHNKKLSMPKELVQQLLIEQVDYLFKVLVDMNDSSDYKENIEEYSNKILEDGRLGEICFDPVFHDFLLALWKSESVQDFLFANRSEIHISHGFAKNIEDCKKILSRDFEPDVQCNVLWRKTVGIIEMTVKLGDNTVSIVDVGGSRGERRKWIHSMANSDLLIFTVSLGEFDEYLFEDNNTRRFDESFSLFREIASSAYFEKTRIAVVFTNQDVLQEKLLLMEKRKVNLDQYFEEIALGDNYEFAQLAIEEFMLKKYSDLALKIDERKKYSFHMLSCFDHSAIEEMSSSIFYDLVTGKNKEHPISVLSEEGEKYRKLIGEERQLKPVMKEMKEKWFRDSGPLIGEIKRRLDLYSTEVHRPYWMSV